MACGRATVSRPSLPHEVTRGSIKTLADSKQTTLSPSKQPKSWHSTLILLLRANDSATLFHQQTLFPMVTSSTSSSRKAAAPSSVRFSGTHNRFPRRLSRSFSHSHCPRVGTFIMRLRTPLYLFIKFDTSLPNTFPRELHLRRH